MSAERLKEELDRVGLSLEMIAEQLDVPIEALTEFNETMLITVKTLQVCAAAGLDLGYIFAGERYNDNPESLDNRVADLNETNQNVMLTMLKQLEAKIKQDRLVEDMISKKLP